MTNAMIILAESVRLMEEGVLQGTGEIITVEDEKGNKKQFEMPEPIHTYAGWKELGYQVCKGQKAVASFVIWKCAEKKAENVEEVEKKMFMKKASFFKASQVEKIA